MGFNYEQIKKRGSEHGSFWTSYSDLFLMLSTVFLLLYVITSLRSGTFGVQKSAECQRLSKQADDLKEQIRVYNTLRDEQLSQSPNDDQQVYSNLMDKLKLLKEEAKDEKDKLQKESVENGKKEEALNRYQQIIRNIINVNVLAKGQIKRRDQLIVTKDTVIEQQGAEIDQKQKTIAENNQKIEEIKDALAARVQALKDAQRREKTSRAAMEHSIAKLKERSAAEIAELAARNRSAKEELAEVQSNLNNTQAKLSETKNSLAQTSATLEQTKSQDEKERAGLIAKLQQAKADYDGQMEALKAEGARKLAAEKALFEAGLKKHQLSAAQKQAKEAAFRKNAEAQARALQGQLADLQGKADQSEQQLAAARQGANRALAAVQNLKRENAAISADLKHAKELADARKNLANAIRSNFQKANIKADVDPDTGDVVLAFPDDYFETGQSTLKEGMESRLRRFVPAYTKSLFSDPKTADKIENVEIIGFASSTFKGKYVNPQSLKESDREAVDYNLRLSFARANAIFKYIFDRRRLTYEHQEQLLPMVKVVGRGYLPEGKSAQDIPEGMPESEFCKKFNCKQAQKVVVKFNLKN